MVRMAVSGAVRTDESWAETGRLCHRQVQAHQLRSCAEDGHERATHEWIAREVAGLLQVPYEGMTQTSAGAPAQLPLPASYFVPDDTLTLAQARALGIGNEGDLLGGVVPWPFLATKVVVHPLVDADAGRPDGWSQQLAMELGGCTLRGFSAFSREDAVLAHARLSLHGGVRLKLPTGVGGHGQWLLESAEQLATRLDALPDDYLALHGVVLEQHLERVVTYSVGEVDCAGLRIAYHGTQSSTADGQGRQVYGGSDLQIQRGSLDALAQAGLPAGAAIAVEAARDFDRAVRAAYPGLWLSRRNYDVACGFDAQGQALCGVLEQSWRIGGATPAELAALQAFLREPGLNRLRACTRERYGRRAPPDVDVYYAGEQPDLGPLVKYRASSRF